MDFLRQVEEAVSAELMTIFRNCEDSSEEYTDDMEAQLKNRFTDHFLAQFGKGLWPPRASAQLGVKAGQALVEGNQLWACSACNQRNSYAFETCRKCSESRPQTYQRSRPVDNPPPQVTKQQPPVSIGLPAFSIGPAGWSCKECNHANPSSVVECAKCHMHQDPYKRDTWPSAIEFPDAAVRREMRMKLFHRVRAEFDMDDPFASTDISHEEFFHVVDRLKTEMLSSDEQISV